MTAQVSEGRVMNDAYGMSMAEIASRFLQNRVDRRLSDKTGITGLFDAHLEYARDDATYHPDEAQAVSAVPSIFSAVQEQLGLKLLSDKGPVEVLVIDHVEQLAEN